MERGFHAQNMSSTGYALAQDRTEWMNKKKKADTYF